MLHPRIAGVIGIVGLTPEGVTAKREVRHEVSVEIGEAPQLRARIDLPVIAAQRHARGRRTRLWIVAHEILL